MPVLASLLAGGCAATPTPGREELAEAIRERDGPSLAPNEVVHIGCQTIAHEPGTYACHWRQLEGRYWHGWQGRLAQTEEGWRIIGEPSRRP